MLLKVAFILFLSLPFLAIRAGAQGQSDESIVAALLRIAAGETAGHIQTRSLEIRIHPSGISPTPLQVFSEEMSLRNIALVTGGRDAGPILFLDVREMNSSTVPLDKSSYLRSVTVSLGVVVEDKAEGAARWSKTFQLARQDTLTGIPAYAHRDLRDAGAPSWIDSVLVPVLTTAAALIIVVLLFTVRGS